MFVKSVLSFALMSVLASHSFAGEPKAAIFREIAVNTVKAMYHRSGDNYLVDLKEFNHGDGFIKETWEVISANPKGSIVYEVEVVENSIDDVPGQEIVSIKIKYIAAN